MCPAFQSHITRPFRLANKLHNQTCSWLLISAILSAFCFVSVFLLDLWEKYQERNFMIRWSSYISKANNNSQWQSEWMWFCASVAVELIISHLWASWGLNRAWRWVMERAAVTLCVWASVLEERRNQHRNSECSEMSAPKRNLQIRLIKPLKAQEQ